MPRRNMTRTLAAALLGLFLTACASSAPRLAASAKPVKFSDELECLADCLEGGDVCEEGVARCLEPAAGTVVAVRT